MNLLRPYHIQKCYQILYVAVWHNVEHVTIFKLFFWHEIWNFFKKLKISIWGFWTCWIWIRGLLTLFNKFLPFLKILELWKINIIIPENLSIKIIINGKISSLGAMEGWRFSESIFAALKVEGSNPGRSKKFNFYLFFYFFSFCSKSVVKHKVFL